MTHYECQDCKAISDRQALAIKQVEVPAAFWNLSPSNTINIEQCPACGSEMLSIVSQGILSHG